MEAAILGVLLLILMTAVFGINAILTYLRRITHAVELL